MAELPTEERRHAAKASLTQEVAATTDASLNLPAGVYYDGDYRVEPGGKRVYDPDRDGDDDSNELADTDRDFAGAGRRVMQENLEWPLALVGELPTPLILEAPSEQNGGTMRVKTPFYIGNSVAKAPGIPKPIFFSDSILPAIVQEGQAQIAAKKQPITVYARHAHAMDGGHLPVGAVVDLTQEGRTGYATLEIAPTSVGKDLQALIQSGHVNAVSLRSMRGSFALKDVLVNEQPMFQPTRLRLDGIDFAPDGPAQPTWGLEILQEARVADDIPAAPGLEAPNTPKRRTPTVDLTLEALRADQPSLVAEIEAPLRRDLAAVTQERDALVAEKRAIAKEAKLREIAAKFPKPDEALPLLLEMCKDCETDDQVAAKAFPILLDALEGAQREVVDPETKLRGMFQNSGRGRALIQGAEDGGIDVASVAPQDVAVA